MSKPMSQPNDPGIGLNIPLHDGGRANTIAGTIDEFQELTEEERKYLNETNDRLKRDRLQTLGDHIAFGGLSQGNSAYKWIDPRWFEQLSLSSELSTCGYPQTNPEPTPSPSPSLIRIWTSKILRYAKTAILFPFICLTTFIIFAAVNAIGVENLDPNTDVGGQDD